MLGVAKPASRAACQSAGSSLARTHGRTRFWSCETRSSLALKRSASSAARSIWSADASPGGWPARLSESVTAR